jgi:acyl-CoA thioesterase I
MRLRVALLLAPLAGCATQTPAAGVDSGAPASSALLPAAAASSVQSAESAPSAGEIRYLALGDSFTIGTGSRPDQSFPARLAARLRAQGRAITVENLGVNGFTTQDLLDVEVPRVAPFAPTFVTLAVGANDLVHGSSTEQYRSQVRRILAALLAAGVPRVGIVALPQPDWSISPAAEGFGDPRVIAAMIQAFNEVLREEATAIGARYVDLFPLMRRQAQARLVADDGLHPAAKAYEEWAGALEAHVPQ